VAAQFDADLRTATLQFSAAPARMAVGALVRARRGGLPLLPFVHPRIASEYHGATAMRQLEPPGFLAMNYGYGTPLTTLLGQTVYGATLGGFLQLQAAMND
jgi:hypothetical protein